MPDCVFNARDPIVVGVRVEEGMVKEGTVLCVPSKGEYQRYCIGNSFVWSEFVTIGVVSSVEYDNKPLPIGKTGQEVCIKVQQVVI